MNRVGTTFLILSALPLKPGNTSDGVLEGEPVV